jgi:hypothetical protein
LFVPANNVYNGQQMNILASGSFGSDSGDPSGTVNVQVQVVTGSLTAPVYTTIASTGANAPLFAAAETWAFDITVVGDNNSGMLTGFYSSIAGATIKIPVVTGLDNLITGLNFASGNPALQQGAVFGLVVGVTFGTSNATNTASLFEFTVEG